MHHVWPCGQFEIRKTSQRLSLRFYYATNSTIFMVLTRACRVSNIIIVSSTLNSNTSIFHQLALSISAKVCFHYYTFFGLSTKLVIHLANRLYHERRYPRCLQCPYIAQYPCQKGYYLARTTIHPGLCSSYPKTSSSSLSPKPHRYADSRSPTHHSRTVYQPPVQSLLSKPLSILCPITAAQRRHEIVEP